MWSPAALLFFTVQFTSLLLVLLSWGTTQKTKSCKNDPNLQERWWDIWFYFYVKLSYFCPSFSFFSLFFFLFFCSFVFLFVLCVCLFTTFLKASPPFYFKEIKGCIPGYSCKFRGGNKTWYWCEIADVTFFNPSDVSSACRVLPFRSMKLSWTLTCPPWTVGTDWELILDYCSEKLQWCNAWQRLGARASPSETLHLFPLD